MANQKNKEQFKNVDFSSENEKRAEFDSCEFIQCTFPSLSHLRLLDCDFTGCNLSNLKTDHSTLQNCTFKDCKLLGLNFSGAKDFTFEVHFDNCILDYASFDRKKMYKSSFKNCRLHSANFTQADLSKCILVNCDLFETLFSGTNLSGIDLTSCINFIIDPELNTIKKAKFSLHSLPGLLQRYEIRVENN